MKNRGVENLKLYYLLIFVLGAILVAPTHIFSPPTFMYARFPHYLEMMGPFLGVSWPMTFEIYHFVLYALAIIVSLNALGIIFYPRLKNIAIASSAIGILLISLIVLFFFFVFLSVNTTTATVYGLYFILLLIVNLLTFKALTKEQKAA